MQFVMRHLGHTPARSPSVKFVNDTIQPADNKYTRPPNPKRFSLKDVSMPPIVCETNKGADQRKYKSNK